MKKPRDYSTAKIFRIELVGDEPPLYFASIQELAPVILWLRRSRPTLDVKSITLLEKYPCAMKAQLSARLEYWTSKGL